MYVTDFAGAQVFLFGILSLMSAVNSGNSQLFNCSFLLQCTFFRVCECSHVVGMVREGFNSCLTPCDWLLFSVRDLIFLIYFFPYFARGFLLFYKAHSFVISGFSHKWNLTSLVCDDSRIHGDSTWINQNGV